MAKTHNVTEDIQIKATVKYHLTPVRMIITKNSSEIVEKRERQRACASALQERERAKE